MKDDDINRVPALAWERLALVPAKLRARGLGWLTKRLGAEAVHFTRRFFALMSLAIHRFICFLIKKWVSRDTLFAIYDLENYPISYDIVWFLVWADLKRRGRGLQRLQCVLVPSRDNTGRKQRPGYDAVVDGQSRAWRFQNICVTAPSLIPGCGVVMSNSRPIGNDLAIIARQLIPQSHAPSLAAIYQETIAGLASEGSEWSGLSASVQGRRYVQQWLDAEIGNLKPVVITLRQYGFDQVRNSNLGEWAAFARSLDPAIYRPVIIPDTDNSITPVPGFEGLPHYPQAAWNVGLRMAINEMAYVNMFVNSGPGSLCFLNRECRYLFFKVMTPTHLASEESLRQLGFEPNTSPRFATPFQKWVWEPDDRAILRREFDAMASQIEAANNRSGT